MQPFNSEFFTRIGFTFDKESKTYIKTIGEDKLSFFVGFKSKYVGTYLEFRVNDKLHSNGHWHDEKDFNTSYQF